MTIAYKHLFRLNGKVAVVTGAAGILGIEFCKALCAMGAQVTCLDSNIENLARLEQQLIAKYDKKNLLFCACDVSNPNSVSETVNHVMHRFSQIDILLNNAATKTNNISDFFESFTDYSIDVWRKVLSVNLDGMFLMAQAVGKYMISQKSGCIIQTASIYSMMAPDQRIYEGSSYLGSAINTPAVYTVSKAGVVGLTKHLAALWGQYGIRVNALCPGGVSSGQNSVFQEKYSSRVPMGRMAEKIDIVGPMLFLASEAARYITGQVLFADGGLSVW